LISNSPKPIIVKTSENLERVLSLRQDVFVSEQGVSIEDELDHLDTIEAISNNQVIHIGVFDGDYAVGTARLIFDIEMADFPHIGRVAVRKDQRKCGVGTSLMYILHEIAKNNDAKGITLSAQVSVKPFYRKLGYVGKGEVYEDVGISHQDMNLIL